MLILIGFATAAFGDNQNNFHAVQAELSKTTYLTGNFTQIRYIKLLSSPLKSAGVFVFSEKNGLIWKQMIPFQSTLTVTDSQLTQKIGNGPVTVFTKKQQPIIFLFTKIFLSAFKGNVAVLAPYFKIHFSGNTRHWVMFFVTRNSPMNKAIKSIELIGGKYVDKVVIDEATGDQQIITFNQMRS